MNFPPDDQAGQDDQARQERGGIAPDNAAARILESITDAFFMLDHDYRFTYVNGETERVLFRTRGELLGRYIWEVFPEGEGSTFDREYRRAVAEGVPVSFEEFYPPLDIWFDVRAYPADGGVSVFFQNVNERRRAQEALRRSQEDLSLAVEAARLGTFYCDYPLDKIVWNDTCKADFFLPPEAEVDFALFYSLLHPDDREPTRQAIERALEGRVEYDVEYRTLAADGRTRWVNAVGRFYYDEEGNPTRFDGVTVDISARKAAEEELRARAERERFLASLAERARALTDPDEVIADAVRSLGQFLGVGRCVFGDIDLAADTCTIVADWCADETVASIVGVFPFSAFGPFVVAEYAAGRAVAVDDVRLDPVRVTKKNVGPYEAMGIRAHITAPVVHSARLVSVIAVHNPAPRHWKAEEVELVQAVVERTWLTVEVTRQQRALVREAEERRAQAERDALLGRVGAAIRLARDPDQVLGAAVWELGQALGADRCYYAAYDQNADTATVGPDWHREGLPTLAGQYPMSRFAINRDPVYKAGRTQVVADTGGDPATQALGLRALVRVPLVSGAAMTALSAAMTDGTRQWTPEEVALVEAVATQTQTALEAVRVQRREHRIAQQLQDALQPAVPERVPGLSVGRFTRPALDEAQVGGDFYDVFPLDKDLFAIVIGDVSGKGLAAAQQLALVRNSLRTTLYLSRAPAEAASALNAIVTAHDLLVGFVTCWVGVYDAATGQVRYCSCGHEPGLVRRAGGAVEALETTGPPLGVAEGAEYGEGASRCRLATRCSCTRTASVSAGRAAATCWGRRAWHGCWRPCL